jgi:hypothetical protein
MRKLVIVAAALVGAAVVVQRLAPRMRGFDLGEAIVAMPDNAPPKWVFNNVTAIRENTERILALLEEPAPAPPAQPSAGSEPGLP